MRPTAEMNMLAIHDLSMNKDPGLAAVGRALKHFYEPFTIFLDAEKDRGSPECDISYGLAYSLGIIIGAYIGPFQKRGDVSELKHLCLLTIVSGLDHTLALPQQKETPTNERT